MRPLTLSRQCCAEEEDRWRRWVDERLVRVITINIYRTAKESFQTFEYITEHGNFNWFEREGARYVGAAMMWAISGEACLQVTGFESWL